MNIQSTSPQATKSDDYRLDLDGLRGIAVLAVIANHLNERLIPNGYLGVDIFFVISGYVISLSLSKYKSTNLGEFLATFYSKRIKRLFPALAVFVISTGIAISFFSIFPRPALNTGIAALLGASNIYLYSQSADYFGESTLINPYTHTWSLGVEEQFYFIFPFIFWFLRPQNEGKKRQNRLLLLLLLLCTASGVLYLSLVRSDQEMAAYYLAPARFWEIGIGAIAFIIRAERQTWIRNQNRLCFIGYILMAGILLTGNQWQVFNTLSVAIATFIVITFASTNDFPYTLLASRHLVSLGKISYSLYLWHWGIICLFRWTLGLSGWFTALALSVTLACSLFSYYLIEIPFRYSHPSTSSANIIRYWLIVLAALTSLMLGFKNFLHQYLYLGSRKIDFLSSRPGWGNNMNLLGTNISGKLCHFGKLMNENEADKRIKKCSHPSFPKSNQTTLAFVGDSHALALLNAERQALNSSFRVIHFSHSGCPFPKPIYGLKPRECEKFLEHTEKLLLSQLKAGDFIVVSQYSLSHFGDKKLRDVRSNIRNSDFNFSGSGDKKLSTYMKGLTRYSRFAQSRGVNILLVGATTRNLDLPTIELAHQEWFRPFPKDLSAGIRQETHNAARLNKAITSFMPKDSQNIIFFDPIKEMSECCNSPSGYQKFYRDTDHLSDYGASVLMSKLLKRISAFQSIANYHSD